MYIVGNWKMNTTPSESVALASEICSLGKTSKCQIWIAPPWTSISEVLRVCANTNVLVGTQNVHWKSSGAYTGEVSAPMLKAVGIDFVIVGHSERRQYFGETSETAVQRAVSALKAELQTILCIGETSEQRDIGATNQVLESQLDPLVEHIKREDLNLDKLLIAYEPVWAIGTGNAAETKDIEEVHNFLKNWFNEQGLKQPPILYGGSVKPENFAEISSIDSVNGALIGGASLKATSFIE
ncbi:MAG: triose-phosphate isomerase [Bdellovibrionota bacterium]